MASLCETGALLERFRSDQCPAQPLPAFSGVGAASATPSTRSAPHGREVPPAAPLGSQPRPGNGDALLRGQLSGPSPLLLGVTGRPWPSLLPSIQSVGSSASWALPLPARAARFTGGSRPQRRWGKQSVGPACLWQSWLYRPHPRNGKAARVKRLCETGALLERFRSDQCPAQPLPAFSGVGAASASPSTHSTPPGREVPPAAPLG